MNDTLAGHHLTALHAAYALMQAAAETGKPHACWAHHRSVGGARTADQLVDRGLFQRRLDASPGDIDTYRYRITRAGSHALGRLHLIEDLALNEDTDMNEQLDSLADLRFTAHPINPIPAPDAVRKDLIDALADGHPNPEGLLESLASPAADVPLVSDTVRRILHTLSAPQLLMLFQVADVVEIAPRDLQSRHMLIERGLVTIVGSPHDWTHVLTPTGKQVVELSKTEPATSHPILTAPPADKPMTLDEEISELREDRRALIDSVIKLEGRVKDAEIARETYKRELDAALDALKSIGALLADRDGVVPDDIEAAARSFKLRLADTEQHAANLTENAAGLAETVAAQKAELDALKTDKRSLELALAAQAGAESQVECDFVFGITPHDLRARWLAGWQVEHYAVAGGKVDVILRREGKSARKTRSRSGNTGQHLPPVTRPVAPPVRTPQPASVKAPSPLEGVGGEGKHALTGDAFIMPGDDIPAPKPGFLGDTPTDPFWRNKQPHTLNDAPRTPRSAPAPQAPAPMASVMDAFTRNLNKALEANPIPQYSTRPSA